MKKILAIISILLILMLSHNKNLSVDLTVDLMSLPSKDDINNFLNSLQNKIKITNFYEKTNLIEEIIVITGNPSYIVMPPLKDAIIEYYDEIGIKYNDKEIENFLQNFNNEMKESIAIILFSYVMLLKSENMNEEIENLLLLFNSVKKASYYLKNCQLNKTIIDPYKKIIIGGNGNDLYENFSFIIELGGNDVYKERENIFILDLKGNDVYMKQNAINGKNIVFDLEGNDEYEDFPYSYNALSFLFDLEGNDEYKGSAVCSYENGISILVDVKGNDIYFGKNFSQSFSSDGISTLIDIDGDDIYTANSYSQCSSINGISLLIDLYGNDAFIASNKCQSFSDGINSLSIFLNFCGDDYYKAGNYSQGFGKNFGIAILFDFVGDDEYVAKKYSQSSSFRGLSAFLDSQGINKIKSGLFSKGFGIGGASIFMNGFEIEGNEEIIEILNKLNISLKSFISRVL